ncbi:hypothetical protein [Chryseobacterium wanjuense]
MYDHHHDDETVSYLYQTLGSTINNADYIFEKVKQKRQNKPIRTLSLEKTSKPWLH